MSETPGIITEFSLLDFDKYIVNSPQSKEELQQLICEGQVDRIRNRFNVWRLCLGVIGVDSTWQGKVNELKESRRAYQELETKHMKKLESKKSVPSEPAIQPVASKNPLAQKMISKPSAPVTTTTNAGDDKFLEEEILKDVQRTYQEREFFTNSAISDLLTKVLFVWSKENSDIGYVQGINEIGASVIFTYFVTAVDPEKKYPEYEGVIEELKDRYVFANSREHAEADIYAVFSRLMATGHKEMFRLESEVKNHLNPKSKINSPILQRISKLSDITLKNVDIDLFRHIKLMDVQMRTFLLRWIRCIHTRQFTLEDSFILWDNILLEWSLNPKTGDMQFIDCTSLAMLIYLRDIVLTKEKGYEVLQMYQKYPRVTGQFLRDLIRLAWNIRDHINNPPTQQDHQKKRKQLFFLEKGFTEQIRKQEIQDNKAKTVIPRVQPSDKEIYPIFYKKGGSPAPPQQISPDKKIQAKPQLKPATHVQPKQQPANHPQEKPDQKPKATTPSPIPMVITPTHNKTPQLPTLKSDESEITISMSFKEWKEVESLIKKSIDQNTDIESKSLSMKALKLLQNKEQDELKKLKQSKSYMTGDGVKSSQ